MQPFRSEFIRVRGLTYHIRQWGNPSAPKLFMLHGWMDVSASFQFLIDCFRHEWHVIAPDWRGFGLTDNGKGDSYWFPDYIGDLDAILDRYSPQQAVDLLGHSMGGNIACMYAGIRPKRINKLINLEGFGLPSTFPEQAPIRYAQWLDELHQPPCFTTYATQADVALRLQKNNPRLTNERAAFLSEHWAKQNAVGRWEVLGDPVHKMVSPLLYRVEEVMACWQAITAPVLWIEGDDTQIWRWMGDQDKTKREMTRRMGFISQLQTAIIKDAGHMLHHDQPTLLAELIEQFLTGAAANDVVLTQ